MHRIDADAHVANQFSDGNPTTGTPGTKVDSAWLNAVQEEVCNLLVTALGVALVKGTNNQLSTALAPVIAKANAAGAAVLTFGAEAFPGSASGWLSPGGRISQNSQALPMIAPFTGKLSKLFVRYQGNTSGGGTDSWTVYVNGAPKTLVATVASGAAAGNDITHEVAVNAGDEIAIYVNRGTTNAGTLLSASMLLKFA